MAFPVKKEAADLSAKFGRLVECCTFCERTTKYWHEATNNPVFPECSTAHDVKELKNWKKSSQ